MTGWVFTGWAPVIAQNATEAATYVAQWAEEPTPPEPTDKVDVTYLPGAHGDFTEDKHVGLTAGDATPDFAGAADENGNPRIWHKDDGTAAASFELTAHNVRFLSGKDDGVKSDYDETVPF